MMLISRLRLLLPVVLLAGVLLLVGCFGGSEVIGYNGGSEVIGQLVTTDKKPVAGAGVKVLEIRDTVIDDALAFDTVIIDSTVSDAKGDFIFTGLRPAAYFLVASYGNDSLVLAPVQFVADSTLPSIPLNQLVMIAPGAIRGAVLLENTGAEAAIRCYIAGTSFDATANGTTPGFTITGIIPADTSYELTVSAFGYLQEVIPEIAVSSGRITELNDTIRLKLDPAGTPALAPSGLHSTYDTISGVAQLTWNRVRYEDVQRYVVSAVNEVDAGMVLDTVDDTLAAVKLFETMTDTVMKTVLLRVAALDNDDNRGPWGSADTVKAIPPAWLQVNSTIMKVPEKGSVDSSWVAMSFSSRINSVVSWKWWADHPDSVIASKDVEPLQSGTDTIVWATSTGKKRLYVSFTDDHGDVTTDSIDAASLLPIDIWVNADSLQYARRYAGACTVDGKIYVFGGCQEVRNAANLITMVGLKYTEMYDPATGEWTGMSPMNFARFRMASAVLDGKIYVFGGTDGVNDHATIERYDPVTDEWECTDTMDRAVVGAAACTVGDGIYLSGGLTGTRDEPVILSTLAYYTPTAKTWATADSLLTGRHLHQMVAHDGNLMVIGGLGLRKGSDELFPVDNIELIPTAGAGVTVPLSGFHGARYGFGAVVVRDKLVLFGGLVGVGVEDEPVRSVAVFPFDGSGRYDGEDMPAAREGMAVVVLDGKIYVIGGSVGGTAVQQSSKAVYVYYP